LRGSGVGRSAYLLQRSRPSVSTARRYSDPTPCTAASCDRLRGVVADPPGTPPLDSRAPSGHFNRLPTAGTLRAKTRDKPETPAQSEAGSPPELPCPSALAEPGIRSFAGIAAPATFRPRRFARPRRFTPPEPHGSISIRNALGLRPSGYYSSRRADASLEAPFLSCRSLQPLTTLRRLESRLGFRVFSPGVRTSKPKCYPRIRAVTLLAFFPL